MKRQTKKDQAIACFEHDQSRAMTDAVAELKKVRRLADEVIGDYTERGLTMKSDEVREIIKVATVALQKAQDIERLADVIRTTKTML